MVELQAGLTEIKSTGTQVVGISYDSVEVLKGFAQEKEIAFPLLSDAGSATIRAYGIHNREGLPHPGTYLIDQDGTVQAVLFLDGYRDRHANDELIEAAKKIAPPPD